MHKVLQNVVATTLTYNRLELLFENYNAVVNGSVIPGCYIIFDNGSDKNITNEINNRIESFGWKLNDIKEDTVNTGEEKAKIKINTFNNDESYSGVDLKHIVCEKNLFCSGGFAAIFNMVANLSYSFLWIMDDDGRPEKSCLENLFQNFSSLPSNYGAVTPLTFCSNDLDANFDPFSGLSAAEVKELPKEAFENKLGTFNGALYSIDAIRKVGSPDSRYHIWGDEIEYRFRFLKSYSTFCVQNATYYHPKLHYFKNYIFGKYSIAPPGRIYYSLRNHTHMAIHRKYKIQFLRMFIKQQFITLFYRKESKLRSFFLNFLAIYHGISENFSNKVNGSK